MNKKDMKEALDLLKMSLRHIKNPTLERAVGEFLLKLGGGVNSMSEMLTKYQSIVITGFTGIVMCEFSTFHADVESRFGRSVWTHEFGNEGFMEEVKEMYKDEFFHLCNTEKS